MEGVGMTRSFWKGKRVLVTGHTGFKGSWLCLWLQDLGAKVSGYALPPPTNPSLFELGQVEKGMASIIGDIRNLDLLKASVTSQKPEIVFHMAAQPLVQYSYEAPVETFSTNVMGTVNMLETIRSSPSIRVAVCITSDKCYENQEWVWGYRESERLGGREPYSSSKACAEHVIEAYRHSYFRNAMRPDASVALASTRAGNVIGGGDWAKDRLVPDIMKALLERRAASVRNPNATRPWQHVLVPLSGYLTLAEKLWSDPDEFNEAWNFGPEDSDAKPVSWIGNYLTTRWDTSSQWKLDGQDHPHEHTYLKLDSSKAKLRLGWQPALNLSGALDWIVEWYRAYEAQCSVRDVTLTQIARYEVQCNQGISYEHE
jgi:CDP-glucose 4,6-dehydratase